MSQKSTNPESDLNAIHYEPLTVGVLTLAVGLEAMRLVEVRLPERCPARLTRGMLLEMGEVLKGFPLKLPFAPDFTGRVWAALSLIPFGQTATYQEIATQVGSPNAARAVGGACGANRLPLAVPCHRVVGRHGLGGFAYGLDWKRELLRLEGEPGAFL